MIYISAELYCRVLIFSSLQFGHGVEVVTNALHRQHSLVKIAASKVTKIKQIKVAL